MTDEPTHEDAKTPPGQPNSDRIAARLNYLRWFAAEDLPGNVDPLNADIALGWFCQTLRRPLLGVLKARYGNLVGLDNQLAVFPHEEVLIEKVLIPLHQAKVAYVLGHELGCIALSGMVAEMLATLRFRVSGFGSGPNAMTKRRQERLFGRDFEGMEHSRRVGILELLKLIDSETAEQFSILSKVRNKYLHRLSEPHEELAKDALRSYAIAVTLAVKTLGLGFKESSVTINPEVLAYIKARSANTSNSQTIDD
jgi:hypothetical protein